MANSSEVKVSPVALMNAQFAGLGERLRRKSDSGQVIGARSESGEPIWDTRYDRFSSAGGRSSSLIYVSDGPNAGTWNISSYRERYAFNKLATAIITKVNRDPGGTVTVVRDGWDYGKGTKIRERYVVSEDSDVSSNAARIREGVVIAIGVLQEYSHE